MNSSLRDRWTGWPPPLAPSFRWRAQALWFSTTSSTKMPSLPWRGVQLPWKPPISVRFSSIRRWRANLTVRVRGRKNEGASGTLAGAAAGLLRLLGSFEHRLPAFEGDGMLMGSGAETRQIAGRLILVDVADAGADQDRRVVRLPGAIEQIALAQLQLGAAGAGRGFGLDRRQVVPQEEETRRV